MPTAHSTTNGSAISASATAPIGQHARPQVDEQHRTAVAVPDLQQAVVQVHLVRRERAHALRVRRIDRHQQVEQRHEDHRRTGQQRGESARTSVADVSASGRIRPDALVVAAASISPMSIEPESPMKIRAGLKLCGRNPRHAPASTTASSAGE